MIFPIRPNPLADILFVKETLLRHPAQNSSASRIPASMRSASGR